MRTNHYAKSRFIGYAIPTGPCQEKMILSKYLVGNYLGNQDLETDLQARISILKNAVDTAKQALPADEDVRTVNNIFLAPEFYFHGPLGPYVYSKEDQNPAERALALLSETFNALDYPNWTFVFGTMISAKVADIDAVFDSPSVQMRKNLVESLVLNAQAEFGNARSVTEQILSYTLTDLRANPAVEVRDRALIFSNLGLQLPGKSQTHHTMTSEKYFLSPIDFVLFETTNQNVVTEEMVAYPHIDLSGGDLKRSAYDAYAIFQQGYGQDNTPVGLSYGVEICLDHDDARLRKNLGSHTSAGSEESGTVNIQLIPSSGSAIVLQSVVAERNGFVFNCDGWCVLSDETTPQVGNVAGVQSVYSNYLSAQTAPQYFAHTQLARVNTPAKGRDPNFCSADFQFLSASDVLNIAVAEPNLQVGAFSDYFAGGAGEVHIYGAKQPYDLQTAQN